MTLPRTTIPRTAATGRRRSLPVRALFASLDRLERGSVALWLPDGSSHRFEGREPGTHAELRILRMSALRRLIWSGDVGFGEAYRDGDWESPDLTALLRLAAENRTVLEMPLYGSRPAQALLRLLHRLRDNTLRNSRRNIRAHYDLGNDFYRGWLDPQMNYSAALFEGEAGRSLAEAQQRKHERILERLGPLSPDSRLLEVGCGWGAFARHATQRTGCAVTGISLSVEQLRWARERAAEAGLEARLEFEYRDYRHVTGPYDHAVSIEMFEAVGERHWPGYFAGLHAAVRPGGRAVVQTITIDESLFEAYRLRTDFIQRHIFPGGMLPSPTRFRELAGAAGWEVVDDLAFGLDYAETLRRWREAFELSHDGDAEPAFHRLWRFYLAYCEAGFLAGSTDVHQYTMVRR